MAISDTDLRLLKSQRLTDEANGGGKMTGNVVVSGELNNLFDDISQLDRTYGRVSLRKAFAAVYSLNADVYLGAHAIITNPPQDNNVTVTMVSTESWTDERDAARNYIENYSIAGPESRWVIYGDQIKGQRLLLLYSISNAASLAVESSDTPPDVGDIMLLSVEKAGYAADFQYVRISKQVSRATQSFNDGAGVFYKDVVVLEISNPLRHTFPGSVPSRNILPRTHVDASPTLLRITSVADAAVYFGVKNLSQAAAINDAVVKVGSPYSAIVPSAQAQLPLIDQIAGSSVLNYIQSGDAASLSASANLAGDSASGYAATLYLGRGILPGTLGLTINGVAYTDADGAIVLPSGATGTYTGVVDYAAGAVRPQRTVAWSATVSATATPCATIAENAASAAIDVTVNNRAYSYVQTLRPYPTPKALVIDYLALGRWYRLYDDGGGRLAGAVAGVGNGTINYATGSVLVTLAALPDVNSKIIFSWATPARYRRQTDVVVTPAPPGLRFTLPDAPVKPGTLNISWNDGAARAAFVAAGGAISGDAGGTVIHASGSVDIYPQALPPSGTDFTFSYDKEPGINDVFTVTPDSFGVITITLSQAPIQPGSVRLQFNVMTPRDDEYFLGIGAVFPQTPEVKAIDITDDGAGGFEYEPNGSIDYSTGVIVLDTTKPEGVTKVVGFIFGDAGDVLVGTIDTTIEQGFPANSIVNAHYALQSATATPQIHIQTLSELTIDLNQVNNNPFVAGSIKFTAAGDHYIDRNGSLFTDHSATNDSAVLAGSVDYESGIATLTQWPGGDNSLSLTAGVVAATNNYITAVQGRAPGAPLATGQFQLSVTAADGVEIIVSADNNGDLVGEWVQGHVDWTTGIYQALFGKYILDSTIPQDVKDNSGWYDPANIQLDGTIFAPRLVKPETLKYNTVLISYIPLDADILGLDNVRLPLDGRVPIYRNGSVVVVHNTQTTALPNPAVAGASYDMGRVRLTYAHLFDADGIAVATDQYSADLDAGTVTMANPLDLSGYAQPLVCEHRIEDMSLVSDVQVTGELTLLKLLTHDFPASGTFVSSALVVGDIRAWVSVLFDQYTWTNVYDNIPIGSTATGSFNDVAYPIMLTNKGAIEERWVFVFTGSTAFSCYGEYTGLVGYGNTAEVFAPLNPATGEPYFSINPLGWGGGWSVGNCLRINTQGANFPLWFIRTTQQGDSQVFSDNFKFELRGDSN